MCLNFPIPHENSLWERYEEIMSSMHPPFLRAMHKDFGFLTPLLLLNYVVRNLCFFKSHYQEENSTPRIPFLFCAIIEFHFTALTHVAVSSAELGGRKRGHAALKLFPSVKIPLSSSGSNVLWMMVDNNRAFGDSSLHARFFFYGLAVFCFRVSIGGRVGGLCARASKSRYRSLQLFFLRSWAAAA